MNKSKIVWLLAIVLCLGACSKHEKDYEDVTPPAVESYQYLIRGVVTEYDGTVVPNATVQTPGLNSVTADENGFYEMQVPEPESERTYTLTASGKVTNGDVKTLSKTVTVVRQNGGEIVPCDFRFHTTTVTKLTNGEGDQETEIIEGNDYAKCLVGARVEGYEGDDLQLETFYFTEDFGAAPESPDPTSGTFEKEKLFFASSVTGAEKNRAGLLYTLFFDFNTETQNNIIIRSFNNGQWTDVPENQLTHESHLLTVNNAVTDLIYAVFCLNTHITLTPRYTPLVFNPSGVDNFYGTAPISVPSTEFDYKTGIDLFPTNYQLQALLLEVIGRDFGLFWIRHTYTWNVDLTLPIGTGVDFSGHQDYTHIKYKKGSRTAEADLFGNVTYEATTYNHQHVGGGN